MVLIHKDKDTPDGSTKPLSKSREWIQQWKYKNYEEVPEVILRKLAAKVIVFGFDGAADTPSEHACRMIDQGCSGVILFSRNVEDPQQVRNMCNALKKKALPRKLLIMVDQEGGRVARLRKQFTDIPSARNIGGSLKSNEAAENVAKVIARELKAVQIDMNLAPVVDVDTNPNNPVIGDRSFSRDPAEVGKLASIFINALQAEGIASCAKHFPGHGDTHQDSHYVMPVIAHNKRRVLGTEIAPFISAIGSNVASIIVGHLMVPSLQTASEIKKQIPSSMSKSLIDYLKKDLAYQGVVMVDDIEMGAIVKAFCVGDAAVQCLQAGIDLLLVCHEEKSQIEAIQAIIQATKTGLIPLDRLCDAADKVEVLVEKYASSPFEEQHPLKIIGSKAHRDLIKDILTK